MSDFLRSLTSLYWWISVVVVGLVINVLSNCATRKLDARLSKVSLWWRERSKQRQADYLAESERLRASPHQQVMARFKEARLRTEGVLYVVTGQWFMLIG